MTNAQVCEENLAKVTAHLQAEFSNDVDQIMKTVAPEPRFAIVTQGASGLELEVAETPQAVRHHYVNLRSALDVVRSRQIRRITGEWFVFQQSVATMRAGADPDGRVGDAHEFPVDTAVLFPIAPGGILGEIPWNRTSFAEAMTTQTAHHEPPTEALIDTVDLHEAFLAAWRSAEEQKVLDLLEDDSALAIRSYSNAQGSMCAAEGKDAIALALAEQFRTWKPIQSTVLDLVVTDWYIFASVRWIGKMRSSSGSWSVHELSTAMTLPVSKSQRFQAIVGYGTTPVPLAQGPTS